MLLNNPLRYIDPTGHEEEDSGATFRATGTGYLGLDPLEELLYRYWSRLAQIGQQTQQMAQQAFNWLGAPRDPGCMTAHTMGGAGVGFGGGATLGAFFGPADVLTVPTFGATGFVGGAAFGRIGGLVSCMSSTGGTGSSAQATGNDKSPKEWQITNPADKKVVGGRTYLKDAKTGTWWSKDTAGHGGSVWKVYKETSPGKLDWIADADAQGNFISGKWKSPVGTSITF